MADKILNTRIQLKYDILTKWQSGPYNGDDSTKWLKPGELAIVTLAPNKEAEVTHTANQHPLLFKVGTGAHKFDDLPWASALAADVYDWAKKPEAEFITWVNSIVTHPTIPDGFIIAVDVTDDDVVEADLQGGKNSVSGTIKHAKKGPTDGYTGEQTAATADAFGESVTIKVPKLTVDTYGHVNSASDVEYTVSIPAAPEITITDDGEAEVPTAATVNVYKNLTANGHALTEELVEVATAKGVADAVDAEAKIARAAEEANANAISAIKDDTDIDSFADVKAELAKKQDTIPANTYDAYGSAATAEQNAKDYVDGKFTDANLAQYTTEQEVKDIVDNVIAGAADSETYNSLTKLVNYIDTHGGEAAEMAQAIEALKQKPGLDKVGTVTSITAGDGLDGGTITESGTIALSEATKASLAKADSALQSHQDISGKADKVSGAVEGNFAGLDANGNLTDSGKKAADFAPADIDTGVHSVVLKSGTNNGTVKLIVDGATTDNIAVTGLGALAYENSINTGVMSVGVAAGFKNTGTATDPVIDVIQKGEEGAVTWIFDCGGAE